ncbi:kinase-like protein [Moniliophthora roreri]|nr:kinase-like protein [Moniliophthora roreri]
MHAESTLYRNKLPVHANNKRLKTITYQIVVWRGSETTAPVLEDSFGGHYMSISNAQPSTNAAGESQLSILGTYARILAEKETQAAFFDKSLVVEPLSGQSNRKELWHTFCCTVYRGLAPDSGYGLELGIIHNFGLCAGSSRNQAMESSRSSITPGDPSEVFCQVGFKFGTGSFNGGYSRNVKTGSFELSKTTSGVPKDYHNRPP